MIFITHKTIFAYIVLTYIYPNTCRVIDIYHRRLSNSDLKIGFQASAWPGGEKSRTCCYISEPASRYLPRNYCYPVALYTTIDLLTLFCSTNKKNILSFLKYAYYNTRVGMLSLNVWFDPNILVNERSK